jgi:hypothetical protein
MIGTIVGIGLAITFFGAAWDGTLDEENWFNDPISVFAFGLVLFTLLGAFLFPRTVGLALTPSVFITPIVFVVAWVRQGLGHGLTMLLLGALMWLSTVIIAKLRPEAT